MRCAQPSRSKGRLFFTLKECIFPLWLKALGAQVKNVNIFYYEEDRLMMSFLLF